MKDGETRMYTIPLRKGYSHKPVWKRTNAAVMTLREFLERHTKMVPKILPELNEYLWIRGNKKPPARVKIKVMVKDGFAYANLEDKEIIIPEKEEKKKEKKKEDKKEEEKKKEDKGAPEEIKKERVVRTPQVKKNIKKHVIPKRK
jgi:ribosomal protein L31E